MDKNQQAIAYMKENKFEEAVKLLSEMIDDNPKDPIGYINLSNLFIEMNQYDEANILLKRAIELDPNASTAYYSLGNSYYECEQYRDAQQCYEQAIELGLEDGDVFFMLGLALIKQSHHLLAIPYLLRATELDPTDAEKRFQYGLSLAKSNYIDEAKEVFNEVLAIESDHSDTHYNLGVISYNHHDYNTSLSHFETALKSQPNHKLAQAGRKKVINQINKIDE